MGVVSKIVAALSRAQSEVERLELEVARWEADAQAKREELAELEAGVGDAVLADETGTAARQLAMTAMELRFTIDGAKAAARSAERKLREARWALLDAQAAQAREQAATVLAEAQKRQARVEELKKALEEFEGGSWRPWQPDAQDLIQAGAAGIVLVPLRTPPLLERARQLDAQAQALEDRVSTERQQAAVLVPNAAIHWDGNHYHGQWTVLVDVGVNDGAGSVSFDLLKNGAVVDTFALPDGHRRGARKSVEGFGDDVIEVRAGGEVLATSEVELPEGSYSGRGRPTYAPAFH